MAMPAISAPDSADSILKRDEVGIALLPAFPFQEIVVSATRLLRILVTDAGARLVDRAAPFLQVEEHASLAVDRVLLVAQDRRLAGHLRIARARHLRLDAEVPGEAFDVALADVDLVVPAAIRRTLGAVVESHQGILDRPSAGDNGELGMRPIASSLKSCIDNHAPLIPYNRHFHHF